MTPTEHPAKTQSPRTGLFATLRASISAKGTRALSFGRIVVVLLAVPAAVLITAAPAFAASLETPETVSPATAITAESATLHGIVNPGGLGLAGGWQFHYAPSETECTGGAVAPGLPELTLGAKEAVEESVTELQPAKKYTFCLVASDLSGESASGALVPFETLAAPPALTTGSEKTSSVTATGANLEATLNPNNEETTYTFEYSEKEKTGKLEGTIVKVPSAAGILTAEFGEPTVSVPTEVLKANTTYFYRVVAENVQSKIESKPVEGPVASFTSAPEAPTTSTPAKSVTATTAVLEGVLNPKAEAKAGWYFAYSAGAPCTGAEKSAQEPEATVKNQAESKEVTGLEPSQKYTFCLVATNAAGTQTTAGNEETLETKPAPPETGSESKAGESPFEATLEAQVNPNNQTTTYSFEYSTSNTLVGAITLKGENPLSGYGNQTASVSTGHHLTPNTTYYYRVLATNPSGTTTDPTIEEFTTPAAIAPKIESEASSAITPEGATLEAQVNPEYQASTCTFQYGTEPALEHETSTAPCTEPLGTGGTAAPGKATIAGLNLHTVYYYRALATNATGTTTDSTIEHFETESTTAPTIEAESLEVKNQTETTAELTAKLNPNGASTSYHVEYDTAPYKEGEGPHGTTVAGAHSITGPAAVQVSLPLTGLAPNTEYHWRLTATNAAGTTTSGDQTFSDPVSTGPESCPNAQLRKENGSTTLPDCRAYEQVTPKEKNGALIQALAFNHPVASVSASGERVIASSDQCFAESPSCTAYRQREGEPYAFEHTPAGWVTRPMQPPASSFEFESFESVDPETGTGIFSAPPSANGPDEFYASLANGSFSPIGLLGEPKPANEPQASASTLTTHPGVLATADLSHVVYSTDKSVWSFDPGTHHGLYEYAGSAPEPRMVGVHGGPGSAELVSACATSLGSVGAATEAEALSEDGRTVYFTAKGREAGVCEGPAVTGLYARVDGELPDAHTVLISAPASTGCKSAGCIENTTNKEDFRTDGFEGASSDGSRVFFTDTQQLTDGASESSGDALVGCSGDVEPGGCNLYESVCAEPCGTPAEAPDAKSRELIDISEGAKEKGGPRVQGVLAVSADGSHVYFVAQGVLTPSEENHEHEKPEDGQDNLYLYTEGKVRFIARLSPADGQSASWARSTGLDANVTADGRYLVFTASRSLTADDTRAEGEAAAQVFEYDAQTRVLKRVSIGENGYNDNGNRGTGDAAILAAFRGGSGQGIVEHNRSPTMSDNGEFVFFESPIALAPGAFEDEPITGVQALFAENVYEYHDGHVYLISDGHDTTGGGVTSEYPTPGPTGLVGVTSSGSDVFFSTFDPLVPGDTDTQRDIYDARIGGGFPAPATPSPCAGEACYAPASEAPASGASGSATFSGPGNLAPPAPAVAKPKTAAQIRAEKLTKALKVCRKKKNKHKRAVCEKQARKAYGAAAKAKKSTRATNDRRATR